MKIKMIVLWAALASSTTVFAAAVAEEGKQADSTQSDQTTASGAESDCSGS